MNIDWLRQQDVDFHKRLYVHLCAQEMHLCQLGLKGMAHVVRDKAAFLLSLGKLDRQKLGAVEAEVRAELSYLEQGWVEHLAQMKLAA